MAEATQSATRSQTPREAVSPYVSTPSEGEARALTSSLELLGYQPQRTGVPNRDSERQGIGGAPASRQFVVTIRSSQPRASSGDGRRKRADGRAESCLDSDPVVILRESLLRAGINPRTTELEDAAPGPAGDEPACNAA